MIPDEKDEGEAEGTDLGHTDKPVGEDLGDETLPADDEGTETEEEEEDSGEGRHTPADEEADKT